LILVVKIIDDVIWDSSKGDNFEKQGRMKGEAKIMSFK
jgi:hypothetical protein